MTPLRILVDTNILISYLLTLRNESAINRVFDALYARDFVLLLPNKLLEELEAVLANKKHLTQRVTAQDRAAFVVSLAAIAEIVPTISEEISEVTRDRKDDYLARLRTRRPGGLSCHGRRGSLNAAREHPMILRTPPRIAWRYPAILQRQHDRARQTRSAPSSRMPPSA